MLALPRVHFCESCSYNAYPQTSTWCLPPLVSLEELAELADNIVEVAAATIAATTTPPSPHLLTEIQLRTEVRRLLSSVNTPASLKDVPPLETDNPALLHTLLMTHPWAGITEIWQSCQ